MQVHSKVITEAIARLLRPLVKIMLQHGMSYGAFAEILKRVYVDVADNEFHVDGRKQSVSRVSVLTGLNRKEVSRVKSLPPLESTGLDERHNRAARIATAWFRDPAYHNDVGDPMPLPFEGKGSFSELVKKYSGDMPPRAVADELQRVGAIELAEDSRLKLMAHGYIPSTGGSEVVQFLGAHTADLIDTIGHNMNCAADEKRFQRSAQFRNVPVEYIGEFRQLSAKLGQRTLEEIDQWLAERDRGSEENLQGVSRARLGVGIYEFEEFVEPAGSDAADGSQTEK